MVLGIKSKGVGVKTVVISPRACHLSWAKGGSTTNGPVKVLWKLEGNTMNIKANGPEGTKLIYEQNESLSGLNFI